MTDDEVLAGILRRFVQSDEYMSYGYLHPLDDDGNEKTYKWLLVVDGRIEISDDEKRALEGIPATV